MNTDQILHDEHPYFDAIQRHDISSIKHYWENGISVYASSESKRDIVGYALEAENSDLLILALDKGYSVDHAANKFEVGPLMSSIRMRNSGQVRLLLERGANPNHRDRYGVTPYLLACAVGDHAIVWLIKVAGADTSRTDDRGENDFMKAASAGHFRLAEDLLGEGRDIDSKDASGSTVLLRYAKSGVLDHVKWALDHGANVSAKDGRGKTALQLAESNQHHAVAELLRQREAKCAARR